MKNVFFQGIVILVLFFSIFLVASKVDWITLFRVEHISRTTEEKLGKVFDDFFRKTETIIDDSKMIKKIDSLITHICLSNDIDTSGLTWYVVERDEVNAFVYPGRHLVIFTGLLHEVENDAALSGVLCHELAHLERNHVMRKLKKEVGVAVLFSVATGNGSPGALIDVAKQLTTSAYSRSFEKEADLAAVDYLLKAEIDPEPFADFVEKLVTDDRDHDGLASWVSSHPQPSQRADYIRDYIIQRQ